MLTVAVDIVQGVTFCLWLEFSLEDHFPCKADWVRGVDISVPYYIPGGLCQISMPQAWLLEAVTTLLSALPSKTHSIPSGEVFHGPYLNTVQRKSERAEGLTYTQEVTYTNLMLD